MSQSQFDAMPDAELRTYFLANRRDQAAFHAHLDRLNRQTPTIVANPNDPNFDEKLQALIHQKLEAANKSGIHEPDSV
jgi:hypothetical protein